MRILIFMLTLAVVLLAGCKNPLGDGADGSSIESQYSVFLSPPGDFEFYDSLVGLGSVTLSWTESARAERYILKYGTASGTYSGQTECASPCSVTGLHNGVTYFFTVEASNRKGTKEIGSELSAMPVAGLTNPIWLSAEGSLNSIRLSWLASAGPGVVTYKVQRSTSTGAGYIDLSHSEAGTTFVDSTAIPGTRYYYKIIAEITEERASSESTEISAIAFSDFSISSVAVSGSGALQVAWGASTGASSYTLRYGTSSGSYTATLTEQTSPVNVAGLTPGATYYFMVTATNFSGTNNAASEGVGVPLAGFNMSGLASGVDQIGVGWGAASGATAYDILYDTSSKLSSGGYSLSLLDRTTGDALSVLPGTTYYLRVRARNANGSLLSNNELSGASYQAFTWDLPFDALTNSSYDLSEANSVELTAGLVRLAPSDQVDDGDDPAGFAGGLSKGVFFDSTSSVLRLNTESNQTELDSSWTPRWSNLVAYWKMNADWTDSKGSFNGGATSGTSFSTSAKLGSHSGQFDGLDGGVILPASDSIIAGDSGFTISVWFNGTSLYTSTDVNVGARFFTLYRAATSSKIGLGVSGDGTRNIFVFISGTSRLTLNCPVNDGKWHQAAVTYSKVTRLVTLYCDGVAGTPVNVGIVSSASADPAKIGHQLAASGVNGGHFNGKLDDLAVWNTDLTASEMQVIFAQQKAKYAGSLESRVMDAKSSQIWNSLSWRSTLPFYKEISSAPEVVSSETGYSVDSTSLNSGLVGLWHLNEATYSGALGEIVDSSGVGAHGQASAAFTNTNFAFGRGATFNADKYLRVPNSALSDISQNVSLCFWMRTTDSLPTYGWSALISKVGPIDAFPDSQGWRMQRSSTTSKLHLRVDTNAQYNQYWTSSSDVYDGKAHHICVSLASGQMKMWIDGVLDRSSTYLHGAGFIDGGDLKMGSGLGGAQGHRGFLDEVSVWNRELTSAEVLNLYRRGANRLKYQIRLCTAADCSDQEALTSSYRGWKGPDNTGMSYFSELYNTASNSLGTAVGSSGPNMNFANFSGSGLSLSPQRYFQYRVIFESEDGNSLCDYGSGAVPCSAELKKVVVGPDHFDTVNPTITSKAVLGSSFVHLNPGGFEATLGSGGCNGLRYTLSNNGSTYYYHDGSNWVFANGSYAFANSEAEVASHIDSFANDLGPGVLHVRSFLHSDGVTPCELDRVRVNGVKY